MTETPNKNMPSFESAISVINEYGFSRISENISFLWGEPEIEEYLNSLLISDRVDRKGFPIDVCRALMVIYDLNIKRSATDKWIDNIGYREK